MDEDLFRLTMSCLSPEQRQHVKERYINATDSSRAFLMGFEHGASEASRMSAERGQVPAFECPIHCERSEQGSERRNRPR